MRVAVVILNWNTADYLKRFLPALLKSVQGFDAEVIVADNASTDDSVRVMREQFAEVRLIKLDRNYGFTGGYNRALSQIEAEYYVLINSDVEVPEDWLGPLLQYMQKQPQCGACAPKMLSWHERDKFEYAGAAGGLLDFFGYPFCRGRILGKVEYDRGQYDSPCSDILWASGACLMVRADLWKELGGLDERFFAHMEEIDLCWRIQLAGFKVCCVPASKVYHIGGGTLENGSPRKLLLNYRNGLLLLENNLAKDFAARGFEAGKACCKARRRIAARIFLDCCSEMIYALTFKWSYVKAVSSAHSEYRKLRRIATASEIERWLHSGEVKGNAAGISCKCLFFEYIKLKMKQI